MLRIISILLLGIGRVHSHGYCPGGDSWNKKQNICWRESTNEMTFQEGINFCIARDFTSGPGANLMPVGQLRNLRNRFDRESNDKLKVDFENEYGVFFVNGVKSPDGLWREYPSGRLINFHHFPEFYADKGDPGDVLIWDSRNNVLKISSNSKRHHVLCYRSSVHKDCERCPGYQKGRECNNAGDCFHGVCICDNGFSGEKCEIFERQDADLLMVGNSVAKLYNFETNTSCPTTPIPEAFVDGKLEYFNGAVHYCETTTAACYKYDSKNSVWRKTSSLISLREQAAFEVIPTEHSDLKVPVPDGINNLWPDDYLLWATGGDSSALGPLASTEIYKSGIWMDAVVDTCGSDILLPGGVSLYGHCVVQINECETALIGGMINSTVSNPFIYVYNWQDGNWRIEGISNPPAVASHGCSLIKDFETGRLNVLVAGGVESDGTVSKSTWTWDPVTGQIKSGPQLSSDHSYMTLAYYSDYNVLWTESGTISYFSIPDGLQTITELDFGGSPTTSTLVPSGLFKCI